MIVDPWWQRIRGARAISWQSVVIGDVLISIAIVASGGTLGGYSPEPGSHARALVVVGITGLLAAGWALIGFRLLFRYRAILPVSLGTYALFYSVNGALYFLAVQWLDSQSGSPSGIGWPARLASSIAISLAWAVAISLLLEGSDRFRDQRQRLLDDMVAAESRRLSNSQEVIRLREALDAQVDEVLASTRSRLSAALAASSGQTSAVDGTHADVAVAVVRSAASEVVRPLSHKLLEQAQAAYPSPRLDGLLREWWESPRMPPLATALLVSSQTTAESVRNFGGVLGPLIGVLYFAALLLFLVAIDRGSRTFPRKRRLIYVLGVVGSLAFNVLYAEGLSPEGLDAGDAIANVVLSAVYIAITSLSSALRQARQGLLESLEIQISSEELRARAMEREASLVVDALARDLHGRVQTQLVVCAAELDRASTVGDHEAFMRAMFEACKALDSATRPRTPTLSETIDAWDALLEVEMKAEGVPGEELARADVIAVIEEALVNAYRHGGAGCVHITFECTADALRIVVTDDGHGLRGQVEGLGMEIMRRLSGDRASVENGAQGAVLTVDLPACSST